jgi:hypothetical protein
VLQIFDQTNARFQGGTEYLKYLLRHESEHHRQYMCFPAVTIFRSALKKRIENNSPPHVMSYAYQNAMYHYNLTGVTADQARDMHEGLRAVSEGGADLAAYQIARLNGEAFAKVDGGPIYQAGGRFLGQHTRLFGMAARDDVLAFPGAAPGISGID